MFAQRFVERMQTRSVNFSHLGKMLREKAASHEFGEGCLCELIGVQVGRLLHLAQPLESHRRRNDPTNAQTGERDFGKAVNVNDDVRAIELFEGGDTLVAVVQAGVDMVFHDRHLIARGHFNNFPARGQRNGCARRILEIRREHH